MPLKMKDVVELLQEPKSVLHSPIAAQAWADAIATRIVDESDMELDPTEADQLKRYLQAALADHPLAIYRIIELGPVIESSYFSENPK